MYANLFGLRENPFTITPDPRYLYMSRQHQEALAHLLYGTGEEGGFVQLTGEVGTGKTTLVRALLEQHLADVDLALVLNPRQTIVEFVATICDELGADYPRQSRTLKPVLDALNQHLLSTHAAGRQTVLVVDEAQNLSRQVLEQVRLLTNLETTRHKLLRIILVGQPELQVVLERHDMRQLAQRITARCHLNALNGQETRDYIAHRLAVADGDIAIFAPAALREVTRRSRGIPRLINIICDRALLGAYARGERRVSRATVRQACHEALPHRRRRPALQWTLAGVLLICTSVAAALYHYWPLRWPLDLAAWPSAATTGGAGDASADPVLATATPEVLEPSGPEPSTPQAADDLIDSGQAPHPLEQPTGAASPPSLAAKAPSPVMLEPKAGEPTPLALAPPNTPEPPPPGPLEIALSRNDPRKVHLALLSAWGEAPAENAVADPCTALAPQGMRCLQETMSWDQLVAWNRPALLTLTTEAGVLRALLLRSLEGDSATVDWGNGPRELPVPALRARWNGEATILWRLPTGASLIGTGSAGAPVRWLRQQLSLFDGLAAADGGGDIGFDEDLEVRVRQFQQREGLAVDGVVGQRTMLRLSNQGPAGDEPRLLSGSSEG
jgi:general secretion pathway protein A